MRCGASSEASLPDCARRIVRRWVAAEESVDRIGEVPRDLSHPRSVRLVDDASDVNAPGLQIDDERHRVSDETPWRQHLNGEELRKRSDWHADCSVGIARGLLSHAEAIRSYVLLPCSFPNNEALNGR